MNEWEKGFIDGVTTVIEGVNLAFTDSIASNGDGVLRLSAVIDILEKAKNRAIQKFEGLNDENKRTTKD